jgi:hypothetical protein
MIPQTKQPLPVTRLRGNRVYPLGLFGKAEATGLGFGLGLQRAKNVRWPNGRLRMEFLIFGSNKEYLGGHEIGLFRISPSGGRPGSSGFKVDPNGLSLILSLAARRVIHAGVGEQFQCPFLNSLPPATGQPVRNRDEAIGATRWVDSGELLGCSWTFPLWLTPTSTVLQFYFYSTVRYQELYYIEPPTKYTDIV